ncbi:uncharacterized protein ACNLHF_021667 isoform 2-T2 [Anomaloglossus baeobatrachus]|uniref:uncharacterized protein LOC142310502 isoform X2 n=1 Tax=Anomaloglossus baeobatrachus TaxID=238106 RepID=UPI003F4F7E41
MALLPPHSAEDAHSMELVHKNLIFEGFLKKRKDTMKFNWAKYWFKLQNTTLYFYTRRDPQPEYLRGQYYMYSVQSVRSLNSPDGDFPFEIVMKNGKRKLLSAESEALRDVWLKLLWKSMQLPGPGHATSSCIWYDIPKIISASDRTSRESVPESAPQGISSPMHDYHLLKSSLGDHSGSEDVNNSDALFTDYNIPTSWICPSSPVAAPEASPPVSPVLSCGSERSSCPDATLCLPKTKHLYPGGNESDDNSDSIYDVPTSRISRSSPPAAAPEPSPVTPVLPHDERSSSPDAVLGRDYMTMEQLNLSDSLALEEDGDCSSGVEAQYMLMSDLDVSSPGPAGSVTAGTFHA